MHAPGQGLQLLRVAHQPVHHYAVLEVNNFGEDRVFFQVIGKSHLNQCHQAN